MRVRRGRLRPKYAHGCGDACGRKPGYCPERTLVRRETKDTKSRAGRRAIGLPDEVAQLLRRHREAQVAERAQARQLWVDKDYVFTGPTGEPLNPNTDYHHWKDLLQEAGVRDARLHDARHTAATVLLLLGVDERVVMAVMGWSSAVMRKRYQHVTEPLLTDTARRVHDFFWGSSTEDSAPWFEPCSCGLTGNRSVAWSRPTRALPAPFFRKFESSAARSDSLTR
jgi:integrase